MIMKVNELDEILVEEYRGGLLECVHRGHICGVTDSGVAYASGDIDFPTFFRSAAKPIQAIPVVRKGLDERYGFTGQETAILAGSHRAEPFHVAALEALLGKIKVAEEDLICLPTYPLGLEAKEELLRANRPKRRIYHNCSGKHLGILTLCRNGNYPTADYWDIHNPAQQEILACIAAFTGYPKEVIKIGVDGCGVPVFAAPLRYLANAYLKLACPDLLPDPELRAATVKLTGLMNEHYEMISGTGRICSLLLMDRNIVAKGGAKGTYCFGLRRERLGFAIKVMDGSEEQWPFIVAAILEQINYGNKETIQRLYDHFPVEIQNDNNRIVGTNVVKFRLAEPTEANCH